MSVRTRSRWEDLQQSLKIAKSERGKHESSWTKYNSMHNSRTAGGGSTGPTDRIRSQLGFSTVEIMVAASQMTRPKMMARPRREDEQGKAIIVEAFLSYWWDKYHVQRAVRRADQDSKIFGHGWTKTTWRYQERNKGRDLEPPEEYVAGMAQDAEAYAGVLGIDVTEDEIRKYLKKQMKQIAIDQPEIVRVSPYDMWMDPTALDHDQVRWKCQRYFASLDSVKNDPNFRRAVRSKVAATATHTVADGNQAVSRASDGPLVRAEIWEMWDMELERLFIWSTGYDDLLYDGDWPYAVGDPFTFLPCFELSNHLYPMGVVELIAPMIYEIDDLLTEQQDTRRRQRVFHLMKEEYLTDTVRKLLESGEDRVVIPIDLKPGDTLDNIWKTVMPPPANPELYREEDRMGNRLFRATGVNDYQRGHADTVRSATEVDTVQQYSAARVREMVGNVRNAEIDVARKLVGLAQQNLTQSDVVRLVGIRQFEDSMQVPAESFWSGTDEFVVPFGREDIAGEFDIILEPGSSLPDSDQARKQAALQLSQILMGIPEADHVEIIKYASKEFGQTNPERFIARNMANAGPGNPPQGLSVGSPPAGPGGGTLPPVAGAGQGPPPAQSAANGKTGGQRPPGQR